MGAPLAEHYRCKLSGPSIGASDGVAEDRIKKMCEIGFVGDRYAFIESCGHAKIGLVRSGCTECKVAVKFITREGTAKADDRAPPFFLGAAGSPPLLRRPSSPLIYHPSASQSPLSPPVIVWTPLVSLH